MIVLKEGDRDEAGPPFKGIPPHLMGLLRRYPTCNIGRCKNVRSTDTVTA
jgi:hypothetical protein